MKKREETIEKVYKEKEHYLDEVKTKEDAFREGINAAMQVLNLHLVSNCFTVIKSNADKLHTDNNCDQMYHCGCGNTTLSDWNKFCPDCGVKLIFQ